MPYLQHFIIEDKYLASTPRPSVEWWPGCPEGGSPMGYAFFCPECTRLWAICPIEGLRSILITRECEKHVLRFPGSIWTTIWTSDFVDNLPLEILRRELAIHLTEFERRKNAYGDAPPTVRIPDGAPPIP